MPLFVPLSVWRRHPPADAAHQLIAGCALWLSLALSHLANLNVAADGRCDDVQQRELAADVGLRAAAA
jgi:hypothetical protein|eukprot:COSAG03_NODE_677_length_6352_cov_24.786982_3_plen_68_part_00